MLDFEVQRCTRRCGKTNRELEPGEEFYSVLIADGSQVVRLDYAVDVWEGAPPDALGWWKSRMPEPNANRLHWAPNDVMLHLFIELAEQEEKQDQRYVLSLLLIRRRIVRLEDSETDERGREVMTVYCPRNETEYKIPVVMPTPERIREIQDELARLLFADAA
ncbi:MAG: hypothetical protein ACC628_04500 [Pirellulaceae bacterium]